MAIRLEDVNVERMAEESELDEDEIREAFGVHSTHDRELLEELAKTKDFAQVLELFRQSNPDTRQVRHQLAQALVDLALLPDQLWAVIGVIISDEQVSEQALSRLAVMTEDDDDLLEIVAQSSNMELVSRVIRRIAQSYKK